MIKNVFQNGYSLILILVLSINPFYSTAQSFASFGYTSTNGTSTRQQLVPTTFDNSKVQIIIRASELASLGLSSGGIISGISYYIKTDNTPSTITANCYADLTSNTEFSSTTFLTQPTFRGSISDPGTIHESWRVVDFTSNITWDGISNLLIQVCRTSGNQGVSDYNRYKLTDFNSILTGYANACNSTTGIYYDRRERPEVGITSPNTTLPVTWKSFTAEKNGVASLLKWSTGSEQNTKDFEVQHSSNTINWTPLGTIVAAGNSTIPRSYSFIHNNPFKGNVYNYYRILQRDLDGKFTYSKIASLIYDLPGADVTVYPNPATESITIYFAESKEVKVINVNGSTVWSGSLQAGRNQISVQNLTKGVYWVLLGDFKKQILIQ